MAEIHCAGCGRSFPEDALPVPLKNGICHDCAKPNYQLAAEVQRLRAQLSDLHQLALWALDLTYRDDWTPEDRDALEAAIRRHKNAR